MSLVTFLNHNILIKILRLKWKMKIVNLLEFTFLMWQLIDYFTMNIDEMKDY